MKETGFRRVLVTGGGGFVGSHLCERLLEAGDDVLCVDNFYTGSKRNVSQLLTHPMDAGSLSLEACMAQRVRPEL